MNIGYLSNQYPHASCTFIRREILALEQLGIDINRYSIRPSEIQIVNEVDYAEQSRTRYVLHSGGLSLLKNFFWCVATRPAKFFSTLLFATRLGIGSDRGLLIYLFYVFEACTLTRWFDEDDIDHVHVHFGSNPTTVAMLCQRLGGPGYSFTVHGPAEFDNPAGMRLGEKIAESKFAAAISSYGRSQLYRWCDYEHWPKVQIVHCGVDEKYMDAVTTDVPDNNNFVFIGRIHEQKGHGVLVEAIRILASKGCQFSVRLLGDGPLAEALKAELKRHGVEDYVEFLGWADDQMVQREIEACRAMVLPSFAEGLPVVLMESLAMGRPAVTTAIAGIPELIETGKCGWLVPAGSAIDLADAMQEALETPVATLTEMGKEGQRRVHSQHNVMTEAKKLLTLLNAVDQLPNPDKNSSEVTANATTGTNSP